MECLRLSFKPGVVLGGRYETVSPLNHGSFGMVFMAKDIQSNRTVAIKCLTKQAAADEAALDLAIDDKSEEQVLHRHLGSHPTIVNLLDSFETDAHVYLVLEFCARGDLYEAIRLGHGPLETEHVRQFMLELVDAVGYIHSKGIYHRDIKPENIFLSESGSMKLGDFGLATMERWTYETTVGSDRYMSPEQFDSAGAGYSPAQADIWAIGVCLLNVLFSRNPFSTPTESDPLFLDFSRDKQSLFDVFPSMSQDTYEVIVQCMNLDPSKRSLEGARDALRRVVSFTTLDEALDDFCSTERKVVATAHREPLRTPSIQSPQVDSGAFPWAKALQAANSPQRMRQLSAIPDNESFTEELFSKSEATTDWISAAAQTPSISSVIDSSFGASMKSLDIGGASLVKARARAKVSPMAMAGSLPIAMTKGRNHLSAMSLVFGRRDTMSKSWSDMWDEDVAEEEEERTQKIHALQEINSRTWSRESRANDDTPRGGLSPATKSSALADAPAEIPSIDSAISNDIDGELVADGFFFEEAPAVSEPVVAPAPYSSPPKRDALDKWAALGERRRAYTGTALTLASPAKTPVGKYLSASGEVDSPRTIGQRASTHVSPHNATSPHTYSFTNYSSFSQHHHQHQPHSNAGNTGNKWTSPNNWSKECPRNKGRDRSEWNWNWNWRREPRRRDFGDVEWVGGWSEATGSS